MNQNLHRHLTALALTVLCGAPSHAFSDTQAESLLRLQSEELSLLSETSPFPLTPIAPIDPITNERTDRVLVGPAFKVRSYGSDYDYYRYVTFYDVSVEKERIYELPIHREECHDKSEVFANYSYSYTYSADVTASASIEGLGLSTSLTTARTFTTARSLRATGEIIANHIPSFLKESWEGRTFIQMANSKTGKVAFLTEEKKETSWWIYLLFPIRATEKYPMRFSVKNADWTFLVERVFIGSCNPGFAD